ncbi:MAG: DUF1801 domain-containing protein [Deltaproteobacteria bacterium]|nr:DUF1801 domain-containing protein [Deltaproteobacteria bacterium]
MGAKKPAKKSIDKGAKRFTADERAAMRDRAREMKRGKADGEGDLLAKVAAMPEPDRALATRLHALIRATAPELSPKTWYGMPAYANRDDKVVCFFQDASKFKSRYATLGFSDSANIDDGAMWPTSFALKRLGPAEVARIVALLKKAVG